MPIAFSYHGWKQCALGVAVVDAIITLLQAHVRTNHLIISHRHRFIFFAVPRTGSHAMRQVLGPHLGSEDWEQQDLFEKKRLPVRELAQLRHGHISVNQLKPWLSAEVWDTYFKFAIVRNPFDRFVSSCFFLARGQPQLSRDPTAFMKRALDNPKFARRILLRPQSDLLTDQHGTLPLDFVGRFEQIQDSCERIFGIIGLPAPVLQKRNASRHEHWLCYYDDALMATVRNLYRRDLENFSYRSDGR